MKLHDEITLNQLLYILVIKVNLFIISEKNLWKKPPKLCVHVLESASQVDK